MKPCAGCGIRRPGRFRIGRLDTQTGQPVAEHDVCSVMCLARWAYSWAQTEASRVAKLTETRIQQIRDLFRAPG